MTKKATLKVRAVPGWRLGVFGLRHILTPRATAPSHNYRQSITQFLDDITIGELHKVVQQFPNRILQKK
jgi:hypothetical protein